MKKDKDSDRTKVKDIKFTSQNFYKKAKEVVEWAEGFVEENSHSGDHVSYIAANVKIGLIRYHLEDAIEKYQKEHKLTEEQIEYINNNFDADEKFQWYTEGQAETIEVVYEDFLEDGVIDESAFGFFGRSAGWLDFAERENIENEIEDVKILLENNFENGKFKQYDYKNLKELIDENESNVNELNKTIVKLGRCIDIAEESVKYIQTKGWKDELDNRLEDFIENDLDVDSFSKGGSVKSDIAKIKKKLIAKAKSKGLYENFGQKEVRELEDKYSNTKWSQEDDDKEVQRQIREFDKWAMNFDLSQLSKGGEISQKEIKSFIKDWGQDDDEIATALDLDVEDSGFSELIMNLDYFWLASNGVWIPEISRLYSEREQKIATYLKDNKDKYVKGGGVDVKFNINKKGGIIFDYEILKIIKRIEKEAGLELELLGEFDKYDVWTKAKMIQAFAEKYQSDKKFAEKIKKTDERKELQKIINKFECKEISDSGVKFDRGGGLSRKEKLINKIMKTKYKDDNPKYDYSNQKYLESLSEAELEKILTKYDPSLLTFGGGGNIQAGLREIMNQSNKVSTRKPVSFDDIDDENIIITTENEKAYINSLQKHTVHGFPLNNPSNLSDNYIMIYEDEEYFVDAQGYTYPRYVSKIIRGSKEIKKKIKSDYAELSPREVWNSWSESQRRHFLDDHHFDNDGVSKFKNHKLLAHIQYSGLPDDVKHEIEIHSKYRTRYVKGGDVGKFEQVDYDDAHNWLMSAFDEEKIDEGFTRAEVEKLAVIIRKLRNQSIEAIDVWESNEISDYTNNLTASYKNKKAQGGEIKNDLIKKIKNIIDEYGGVTVYELDKEALLLEKTKKDEEWMIEGFYSDSVSTTKYVHGNETANDDVSYKDLKTSTLKEIYKIIKDYKGEEFAAGGNLTGYEFTDDEIGLIVSMVHRDKNYDGGAAIDRTNYMYLTENYLLKLAESIDKEKMTGEGMMLLESVIEKLDEKDYVYNREGEKVKVHIPTKEVDEKKYYIVKGSQKVDSFYLNSLPVKHKWYGDVKDQTLPRDKFNLVEQIVPNQMFPIRQNSWMVHRSEEEAKEYIDNAKKEIENDKRFSLYVKKELLKYINTFKVVEGYADGGNITEGYRELMNQSDSSRARKPISFDDIKNDDVVIVRTANAKAYINSLPRYTVDKFPAQNNPENTTKNYIMIHNNKEYFVDTQAFEYPRYVAHLKIDFDKKTLFKKIKIEELPSTSRFAYLKAKYENIVKAFGNMSIKGDEYKSDAEWHLKFDNGTIVTIYNYKNGKNYLGKKGLEVEKIINWHIGSNTKISQEIIDFMEKETNGKISNEQYSKGAKIKKIAKFQLKKFCPIGTKIQSLIFYKTVFSKSEARQWCRIHNFKSTIDEKERTYRCRQENPKNFKKKTFRTIKIKDGIRAVIGCPK